MNKDVAIGAGLGGITGVVAGGFATYLFKKKEIKNDLISTQIEQERLNPTSEPNDIRITSPIPIIDTKSTKKEDPLVDNLKRLRSSDFADVFEIIIKTFEFFGNTKPFISLCRNVELILDLSCIVSENGVKIEPLLLRKGSLYLTRIKSCIIDLSKGVKSMHEVEFQENSKLLLELLDGYYQNIVSDVTLKM